MPDLDPSQTPWPAIVVLSAIPLSTALQPLLTHLPHIGVETALHAVVALCSLALVIVRMAQ